jgi:BirA family biotin operon repressor/biotin-[acetyl-CoA-carboxylase] ligase
MTMVERSRLDAESIAAEVVGADRIWTAVETVAVTASTNADLLSAAESGAVEGQVLVAEFQEGGRGRLDRSWSSPAGAGLTFSLLVRPTAALTTWGWLPLLTGVALCQAVGGDARLKWPNDLLVGAEGGKAAGILVQTSSGAAVIGVGLNVTTARDELPVDTATSLALAGIADADRAALLVRFLNRFEVLYRSWAGASGDAELSGLAALYRGACATIGSAIAVRQKSGDLRGTAMDVDSEGRLLVQVGGGSASVAVAAGDVTHVRPG